MQTSHSTEKRVRGFSCLPLHLENRILKHQAHSRCFGESQSPDSGCAMICREKTTRHHRKKFRSLVGSSWQRARNSKLLVPGGSRYGQDRQRSDTPVQPNVRALKRPYAVIRRRQWGRLRENHARGEIPRGAGELPAV